MCHTRQIDILKKELKEILGMLCLNEARTCELENDLEVLLEDTFNRITLSTHEQGSIVAYEINIDTEEILASKSIGRIVSICCISNCITSFRNSRETD